MSGNEYSTAILSSIRPEQAAELLKERLARGQTLNEDIADWVRERAKIEERYAADLEKLAQRQVPAANGGNMGTLVPVWKSIVNTVQQSSQGSIQLAHKLHTGVEAPLRKFGRSDQVQDIRILQEGLVQLADTLQMSEDKHHKLTTAKKSKQNAQDIEQAQIQVVENQSQWENQAPFAFDQFESVDQSRLVLLKDVLTRFESLQVDRSQENIKSSEHAMNTVLSFDPNEEIKTFAAQVVSGESQAMGMLGPQRTNTTAISRQSNDDLYQPPPPRAASSRFQDESSSVHSNKSSGRAKLRSRVGSIFSKGGRKKNQKHQQPSNPSLQERQWPAAAIGATGNGPAVDGSGNRSEAPPPPPPPHRQSSMPAGAQNIASAVGAGASAGAAGVAGVAGARSGSGSGASQQPPPPPPPPSRKTNGFVGSGPSSSKRDSELPPVPAAGGGGDSGEVDSEGYTIPKNSGTGYDSFQDQQQEEQPFKVNIRRDTIAEEDDDDDNVALSTVASKLRARPTISGRSNRGRRDIQSRLFTNIEPSNDEQVSPVKEYSQPQQSQQVPPPPQKPSPQLMNQLQQFPNQSQPQPVQQPGEAALPVEESSQKAFEPTQQEQAYEQEPKQEQSSSGFGVGAAVAAGVAAVGAAGAGIAAAAGIGGADSSKEPTGEAKSEDATVNSQQPVSNSAQNASQTEIAAPQAYSQPHTSQSETQSLRSVQSGTSTTHNVVKHPDLPGTAHANSLAATNVELINVLLTDGAVVKSAGRGEIAIGFQGTEGVPAQLDLKFEDPADATAHVTANKSIIQPKEDGQFRINAVKAISGVRRGVVGFQYVLKQETIPVIFTPIWRLEDKQASLMLTYKLASNITEPVTIEELAVSVPVEGGEATSAQSKPMASFNKNQQRINWRFAEPQTLNPGVEEQLLVRFLTNGQVKEGKTGIDIKYRVSGLPMGPKLLYSSSGELSSSSGGSSEWIQADMTRTILTGRFSATSAENVKIV